MAWWTICLGVFQTLQWIIMNYNFILTVSAQHVRCWCPNILPFAQEPCHGPSCVLLMAREEAKLLPIFLLKILIATIQQGQQDWQQHDDHKDHDHDHAGDWAVVRHRDGAHVKYHHHPKQQHAVQQIARHDSPWFEKGDAKEVHLAVTAMTAVPSLLLVQKYSRILWIWVLEQKKQRPLVSRGRSFWVQRLVYDPSTTSRQGSQRYPTMFSRRASLSLSSYLL